jgi:hypothetical protein
MLGGKRQEEEREGYERTTGEGFHFIVFNQRESVRTVHAAVINDILKEIEK